MRKVRFGIIVLLILAASVCFAACDDGSENPPIAEPQIEEIAVPAADTTEFVYNGSEQTYSIAASDKYTVSGNKQTNAGSYTVTVALSDKEHTAWADGTASDKKYTFTIRKAANTITSLTLADWELFQSANVPQIEATYGASGARFEFRNKDGAEINTPADIGTYTLRAVIDEGDNWLGATKEAEFSITAPSSPIAVPIPTADNTKFVYNGSEQTYTIAANSAYSVIGNRQTDAGTYTVTVKLTDDWFKWEGSDSDKADKTFEFVIAKADNNIAMDDIATVNCGGLPTLGATAEHDAEITYTYSTSENGEYLPLPESLLGGSTYWLKATAASTANYNGATVTKQFTVQHTASTVYERRQGIFYTYEGCVCGSGKVDGSDKELVHDAENGTHEVTVCEWTAEDIARGSKLLTAFGNNWVFTATAVEDSETFDSLDWRPTVKYSGSGYLFLALPLMDYSAYDEVYFRVANNASRPFYYGTLVDRMATLIDNDSPNYFTFDTQAVISVKDGKVYANGEEKYTLDPQVNCGALPLTFAVKGSDNSPVYVSNLTAKFAEGSNATPSGGGMLFAANAGNTAVIDANGKIACDIGLNDTTMDARNIPAYFFGSDATAFADSGFYAHIRNTETYSVQIKPVRYAAYTDANLGVTVQFQTKNNANGFTIKYGDVVLIDGVQNTAYTLTVWDGKIYGNSVVALDDDVNYGVKPLTLTVTVKNRTADKYSGLSISAVEAANISELSWSVDISQTQLVKTNSTAGETEGATATMNASRPSETYTYNGAACGAFVGNGFNNYKTGTFTLPKVTVAQGVAASFYFAFGAGTPSYGDFDIKVDGTTVATLNKSTAGTATKITICGDGKLKVNDQVVSGVTVSDEILNGEIGFTFVCNTDSTWTAANNYINSRISQNMTFEFVQE